MPRSRPLSAEDPNADAEPRLLRTPISPPRWQRFLVACYGHAVTARILRWTMAESVFIAAYFVYKNVMESPAFRTLQPYVTPGTTAIDVGANIGFCTRHLADWVGDAGHVVAIEPEPDTFRRLTRVIGKLSRATRVETICCAATDRAGFAHLVVNPHHQGDHRLGQAGLSVPTVTLDSLFEDDRRTAVSFIKIDVQGAEMRVLLGAQKILKRFQPVLLIEIDDAALREQGTSARHTLEFLHGLGYVPHELTRDHPPAPLDVTSALDACLSTAYRDLLFLPGDAV